MRLLGPLLLLASLAAADRQLADFRLRDEPGSTRRGWILSFDQSGVRFEPFGERRSRFIAWEEMEPEDAAALQCRLGLAERGREIDGHRLRLDDGSEVTGLLHTVGADGCHWLRRSGLVEPYPKDRVREVTPVRLPEREVFTTGEIYLRRLEERPPGSAREHRDLADWLFESGDMEGARGHYARAIGLEPALRETLASRLDELEAARGEDAARRALRAAKSLSALRGDHDRARAMLDELARTHPGFARAAARATDEIDARQRAELIRRAHQCKHEEMRAAMREFLLKKAPSLAEAMSWTTAQLPAEIAARVAGRLNLPAGEVAAMLRQPCDGAFHWASYWSGTFIVDPRAARGKPSKSEVRGDPDSWWATYGDLETRCNLLRACAAERNPGLFEVVQVKLRDCEACGGTGRVRHTSATPVDAVGGHAWTQTCPRCFGACKDRIVAYR